MSNVRLALVLAGAAVSCAAPTRQLYEGEKLPPERTTALYTNPHLEIGVDRQHAIPARGKLERLELPAGHHTLEVRCHYSNDVPWYASEGDGPAPALSPEGAKFAASPVVTVTIDGEPGKAYKPRARFTRNAKGIPGCRVKVFDVTDGGAKEDLY